MASNVVSTTGSTRANMGASTVLTGVLKDVYLDGLTNTVWYDPAFTALIPQKTAEIDATGRRIIHAWRTGRSAGVGPIAEGGDFRTSVPIAGAQGYEWLKYDNAYFEITGPAEATVKAGKGSYVDIVSEHMTSIMESAKMNIERISLGQADGRLGDIGTGSTVNSGSTMYIDGPAFFDTLYFEPNMEIEFHNDGGFGTIYDYDGSTAYTTVSSLTTGNKRSSTLGTITIAGTMDGSSELTIGDHITRRLAYTSTTCLEGNGLMNLISDGADTCSTYHGAETTNNYKYIWPSTSSGKDRTAAGNEYLKSEIVDISAELDEENLLLAITELETHRQGRPNLFVVTKRALLKYFSSSTGGVVNTGFQRFNNVSPMTWVSGFKGMGVQLGNTKLMLTALATCPEGIAFMINTNDFAYLRPPGMSGYKWLPGDAGNVLRRKEGSDNVFATAVDYYQMVCFDPGKQAKLHTITE